ncbi:MAG TPA: hypothetical protein VEG30_15545 [Terriglobales bacterium]|nr:hypothetical protein [Terriglobales bacterium]
MKKWQDSLLLTAAGILVVIAMFGSDWLLGRTGLSRVWQYFVMVNVAFFGVIAWRLRKCFRNARFSVLFATWALAHTTFYYVTTREGIVPALAWLVLFPLEAMLIINLIKPLSPERRNNGGE